MDFFGSFLHSECLDWGKCDNFPQRVLYLCVSSAHAEPHQEVVGATAARAHANTILDYLKKLPGKVHQSLEFGPFSALDSAGGLC